MSTAANPRKLGLVGALTQIADQAGISLLELAIAFVVRHPDVTAAFV
jgi:aryl-alcohol dehydrogenase-like predicted oxidoreductase